MNISQVTSCFGCMACQDVCAKHCITLRKDKYGHIQPYFNKEDCVDCGLCLKICPSQNPPLLNTPIKTIASWRINEDLRMESSSGGVASSLAEQFVNKGGIVYGCAFVPPFNFQHIRCTSLEELKKIKGSKYVQSDLSKIYPQVSADLKAGRKVLMIGTPCQIAAVRNRFKYNSLLYTIDLVCHGVPSSHMLYESFPKEFEHYHVDNVVFRACTKYNISAKCGISVVYDRPLEKDFFMKGFFTGLFYRESCYSCPFAQANRVGDISLGDFWGVKLDENTVDKSKGVSLSLVNTEKGSLMMQSISSDTQQVIRPLSEALKENKQLSASSKKTFRTNIFKFLYPFLGFKCSVMLSIPEVMIKNLLISLFNRCNK